MEKLLNFAAIVLKLFLLAEISTAHTSTIDPQQSKDTFAHNVAGYKLLRDIRPYLKIQRSLVRKGSTVYFGLELKKFLSLDENAQFISVVLKVSMEWVDPYLTWNPAAYGGVEHIVLPKGDLWQPDIVLYNCVDDEYKSAIKSGIILLNYTGGISYTYPISTEALCLVDVKYFPFDQHVCPLQFGSWAYTDAYIDLKFMENANSTDVYHHNNAWDMRSFVAYHYKYHSKEIDDGGSFPILHYDITIRRRYFLYVAYLILPNSIMNFLCVVQFLLPSQSNERVGLGITLYLSLLVYLILIESILPSTEKFPLVVVYIFTTLLETSIAEVFTILILSLHNTGMHDNHREVSAWMKKYIIHGLSKLVCFNDNGLSEDEKMKIKFRKPVYGSTGEKVIQLPGERIRKKKKDKMTIREAPVPEEKTELVSKSSVETIREPYMIKSTLVHFFPPSVHSVGIHYWSDDPDTESESSINTSSNNKNKPTVTDIDATPEAATSTLTNEQVNANRKLNRSQDSEGILSTEQNGNINNNDDHSPDAETVAELGRQARGTNNRTSASEDASSVDTVQVQLRHSIESIKTFLATTENKQLSREETMTNILQSQSSSGKPKVSLPLQIRNSLQELRHVLEENHEEENQEGTDLDRYVPTARSGVKKRDLDTSNEPTALVAATADESSLNTSFFTKDETHLDEDLDRTDLDKYIDVTCPRWQKTDKNFPNETPSVVDTTTDESCLDPPMCNSSHKFTMEDSTLPESMESSENNSNTNNVGNLAPEIPGFYRQKIDEEKLKSAVEIEQGSGATHTNKQVHLCKEAGYSSSGESHTVEGDKEEGRGSNAFTNINTNALSNTKKKITISEQDDYAVFDQNNFSVKQTKVNGGYKESPATAPTKMSILKKTSSNFIEGIDDMPFNKVNDLLDGCHPIADIKHEGLTKEALGDVSRRVTVMRKTDLQNNRGLLLQSILKLCEKYEDRLAEADRFQLVRQEWQQIANILDRFLFFVFFGFNLLLWITLGCILIVHEISLKDYPDYPDYALFD